MTAYTLHAAMLGVKHAGAAETSRVKPLHAQANRNLYGQERSITWLIALSMNATDACFPNAPRAAKKWAIQQRKKAKERDLERIRRAQKLDVPRL